MGSRNQMCVFFRVAFFIIANVDHEPNTVRCGLCHIGQRSQVMSSAGKMEAQSQNANGLLSNSAVIVTPEAPAARGYKVQKAA